MKLKYVTLTGADDGVDPQEMISLSTKYPYVEWAILFSQSKSGVSRYPSYNWVLRLLEAKNKSQDINLAAHLCGKWVDDAMGGEITFFQDTDMYSLFKRIQLNMGKDRLQLAMTSKKLKYAIANTGKPVIFGGNYKYIHVNTKFFIEFSLHPLFDASGGRGVLSKEWPKPFLNDDGSVLFCGYAGGLGPDNVADELKRIEEIVGDAEIWIDMETSLRSKVASGDRFDLTKCEQVLQAVQPWLE